MKILLFFYAKHILNFYFFYCFDSRIRESWVSEDLVLHRSGGNGSVEPTHEFRGLCQGPRTSRFFHGPCCTRRQDGVEG